MKIEKCYNFQDFKKAKLRTGLWDYKAQVREMYARMDTVAEYISNWKVSSDAVYFFSACI